jgi:hypothetical protein
MLGCLQPASMNDIWLAGVSPAAGGGPPRRETRARKVSQRMAIVDESTRQQVTILG